MRKYMTKEVTSTHVKIARITVDEKGLPKMEQLADEIMLGTVSRQKAEKAIAKKYPLGVTIYAMEEVTHTYKMKVTDFIKIAELVQDENDTSLEEEEEEEEEEQTPTQEITSKGNIRVINKETAKA